MKRMKQTFFALFLAVLLLFTACADAPDSGEESTSNAGTSGEDIAGTGGDGTSEESTDEGGGDPAYTVAPTYKLSLQSPVTYDEELELVAMHAETDLASYTDGAPIRLTVTLTNRRDTDISYYVLGALNYTFGVTEETVVANEAVSRVIVPKGESLTVEFTFETAPTARLWRSGQVTCEIGVTLSEYEDVKAFSDRLDYSIPLIADLEFAYPLDSETDAEIREAYFTLYGETARIDSADDVNLRPIGLYHGVYVLFVNYDGEYVHETETTETVDGIEFRYSVAKTLDVYCDGVFYKMQEAFDAGVLTSEDIAAIDHDYRTCEGYLTYYAG